MKDRFKGKAKRWFVVGGLLLLMSITSVGYVQAASLTNEEIYWLTYIREEEKLARDVYIYFYNMYRSRIFDNISASEQRHMDRIKDLLVKYEIPDPVVDNTPGEFSDRYDGYLAYLYKTLTDAGSVSLVEALKVGVLIEETDIEHLTAGIAATIPAPRDIIRVYSNLLDGSQNHLDAFCSELAKLGEECLPYELPTEPEP